MAHVVSVNKSSSHTFSKESVNEIYLIAGEGIEGDAHKFVTVKHRSRVKVDPSQPNLRQVHLIHLELIHELQAQGFQVEPASMGENITTQGIDLLSLPKNTRLKIGSQAVLQVTGLRNPCKQLDQFQEGLTQAVLDYDADGNLIRKAGIMAIVAVGGWVKPGDRIEVTLPQPPFEKLERV